MFAPHCRTISLVTGPIGVMLGVVVVGALLSPVPAAAQEDRSYKVLATTKTSTMQKEMQDAGEAGFRFVAVMGGETAIGGKEVVVLMERTGDVATRYEYRLLATSKTSTLQKELQQAADAGWQAVGQTVFDSTFGGKESAAILERDPASPTVRHDYTLIATSRSAAPSLSSSSGSGSTTQLVPGSNESAVATLTSRLLHEPGSVR